jgi:glyoxylase-like metal-dependent hydrolase (beta-lactamase superfamily II)
MSAVQVSDHLTQLVHRRVFNCYLVREDDGATLIDTGPAGAVDSVRQAIERSGQPLRRLVITHGHRDHVAGVDDLFREHGPELEVIAGQREAALLTGDLELQAGEADSPLKPRSYATLRTTPTTTVTDGDRVGSLRVIGTPGHTPGHLSLIDTRDGTLIAGDALTTIGRVAVAGELVWRWPFPAISTWNRALARQSARRLLEQRPLLLATGHGAVIPDATDALAKALERRS